MMPTSVFDNGTDKLGLLTEDEIQEVTSYYASAEKINALAERITLNPEEANDPDSRRETPLASAYYSERDYAIEQGGDAITKIQQSKSEVGLRAYISDFLNR